MNRLFELIIEPLSYKYNVKTIVEVGCFDGKNTEMLLNYCRKNEGFLYSIDPAPKFDYEEYSTLNYFKFCKDLSLNVLSEIVDADMVILDGDHNWYTVYNELRLIEKNIGYSKFPLILIHDVGWPYARRDLYYNPDNIPAAFLQPYAKKGISKHGHSLVESGGLNSNQNNALYENNLANGVLTAVEDFIRDSQYPYEFVSTDAFYGLGVLIAEENKHKATISDIEEIIHRKELISLLESTRTDQIISLNNRDHKIEENKRTIETLFSIVKKLEEEKTEIESKYNSLNEQNKEHLARINNQILELNKAFSRISEIEGKNAQLMSEIRELKNKLNLRNSQYNEAMKAAHIHKNSFRYQLGDAIVTSVRPTKNIFKMPLNIYRATKRAINKKKMGNLITELTQDEPLPPLKLEHLNHNISEPTQKVRLGSESHSLIAKNISKKVSIIVPIYNAYEDVKKCIESIFKNTTGQFELILIDDCSTDERMEDLYEQYKLHPSVRLIKNEKNMGYVENVNLGIKETFNDVILLNSDTVVTRRWNKKLQFAAYIKYDIATVTPFSNAAGAFSVPIIGAENQIPSYLCIDSFGKLVENISRFEYPEVPTGNGFCMYIKREAIENIGLFDTENFKRGYGEENDYCMRAQYKGWRNIIDDSTFIYHKRSASFNEEKNELIKKNREVLDRLHPSYTEQVRQFVSNQNINNLRMNIQHGINSPTEDVLYDKKRILYVLHQGSGGTPSTNKDLMSYIKKNYECFVLTSDTKQLKLWMFKDDQLTLVQEWEIHNKWSVENFREEQFSRIYLEILHYYSIDLIHIRHLLAHSFDLPFLAKQMGLKTILSFHDFYFICPTIHLLDNNNHYCSGSCTAGQGTCKISSGWISNEIELKHKWIYTWREKVSEMFNMCDAFVTTSQTSKDVFIKVYPQLQDKNFAVIEHGRDLLNLNKNNYYEIPHHSKPIKILFPGNIDNHKGLDFISELKKEDKENKLEFHFMGRIDPKLKGLGVDHGVYKREQFYNIIENIKPSFVAIFSIWPETYCHTLSEAWMCGIPVLSTQIGTLKERIDQHGGGWFVDHNDPRSSYHTIIRISRNKENYLKVKNQVKTIRIRSTDEMGKDYDYLYRCVLSGKQLPKIALFVRQSEAKTYNPSGYVRLLLPLYHNRLREEIYPNIIDNVQRERFLEESLHNYDSIVIQRDCLDINFSAKLIEKAKENNIKVIYEIDDDLLGIDNSHAEFDTYKTTGDSIKYLLKNADVVTVSTEPLRHKYQHYNENIIVIENSTDERLWLCPIEKKLKHDNGINLGFIGSFSHQNDLALMTEVIERLQYWGQSHSKPINFIIIGGTKLVNPLFTSFEIPKGLNEYPLFVQWLRRNVEINIGIAPLENSVLNESKSGLRYLDYAALEIPTVFSDSTPFRNVIRQAQNGLLASNAKEWEQALKKLIIDTTLRSNIKQNAHTDLIENYLLKDNCMKWLDVLVRK